MARSTGRPPDPHRVGRDTPSARTTSRPSQRMARARGTEPNRPEDEATTRVGVLAAPHLSGGVKITRRAVAVMVILAILVISYISSLRVYLGQQQAMAVAQQQIATREHTIADLQDQITRWQDPDYIRAQARDRLGWVVPGETGYRVIGPDGRPYGDGAEINRAATIAGGEHAQTWWERAWGSVIAADRPTPATPSPQRIVEPTPAPKPNPTPGR